MPALLLTSGRGQHRLEHTAGSTLRETLHLHHIWTSAFCAGNGACGRCRVRVDVPDVPLTRVERARLSERELANGVRLACQVRTDRDVEVGLDAGYDSGWRDVSVPPQPFVATSAPPWSRGATPLGLAIDLGTTHLRLSLWDVAAGRPLARKLGVNPQVVFGADVLSRLTAAAESPSDAAMMRGDVTAAIADVLPRVFKEVGRSVAEVGRAILVGNSAMLALATGQACAVLLDPDAWERPSGAAVDDQQMADAWGFGPGVRVHAVAPLAGFVGSDLVAAVSAARLCDGPAGALLVDFGTNSEVALWDGDVLWVTSAAGGPAFEGSGIVCGMPAIPGAIRRVTLARPTPPRFLCDAIGDGPGEGLTGSAFVDAVAGMVAAGLLTRAGNLAPGLDGAVVIQDEPRVEISKRDVDSFQRAKAAIAAASSLLMLRAADDRPMRLQRVCVCGSFGEHLGVAEAQVVGLLPSVPGSAVELHGAAALAGAERWLFDEDPERQASEVAARARVLNLANDPRYESCFIEHLALGPMSVQEASTC